MSVKSNFLVQIIHIVKIKCFQYKLFTCPLKSNALNINYLYVHLI